MTAARRGWRLFPREAAVEAWVDHARPTALATLDDPRHARWWRSGGTWFAGVNVLPNDARGRLAGGPPLAGAAVEAITRALGAPPDWDPGQVSVCRPGYPVQEGESDAAFRFRRDRDAAHVDGLVPEGPARRRVLAEPHAFLLGLPLTDCSGGASPFVVWDGSHIVMARALSQALGPDPALWPGRDVTAAYQAARRACFETCERVEIAASPGEAVLVHRLALHGMARWRDGAKAPPEGRAIAYFRPLLADPSAWPDLSRLALP